MEEKEGRKEGRKGLLSRPDLRVVKEKEDESCGWKGGRSHTCGLGVASLIRPSKYSLLQRRLCVNKHVKKHQLCVCDFLDYPQVIFLYLKETPATRSIVFYVSCG